jgi:hypothetical protein
MSNAIPYQHNFQSAADLEAYLKAAEEISVDDYQHACKNLFERINEAEAERDKAKAGLDSCIADLREAANICKGVEAELATARQDTK